MNLLFSTDRRACSRLNCYAGLLAFLCKVNIKGRRVVHQSFPPEHEPPVASLSPPVNSYTFFYTAVDGTDRFTSTII
jgi:hypothetical protein